MSALVEPRQKSQEPAADLRPVPPVQGGLGRLPFLIMLAGVLVAGLVGLLMLQTKVQEQSFEVRQLQTQATELAYKQAQLEADVQQKATPGEIARQATALGMVPNPYGVYIDVRTGGVVGTQKVVHGNEVPNLTYKSAAQRAAEAAAAAPSPEPAQPGDSTPQETNQ
ncbi:MAG TPA: cell division protein FtsL [Propionibacteriaceae bacterium]|nr:cell division protein FtsL [Propionibacteriaceae bacterium]